MGKKILVCYATRCGSTGEIAERIASVMKTNGHTVNVLQVKRNIDIEGYDAVVLGSAIRIGKCLGEAIEFVKQRKVDLQNKKLFYFGVCMMITMPDKAQEVQTYLDSMIAEYRPVAHEIFAGKVDYAKLSFPIRLLMKQMKAQEGDFVDWQKVDSWAKMISKSI
ncbi:MAG: hypothetical protein GX421_06755 [Caldisericales bacterium]|nr:hypothetical protein [Caldisericales bacterium]